MGYDAFDVENLTKHFLSCTPINILDAMICPQSTHPIDLATQKQILDNTVNSSLIKEYPIKHSYQIAFLKWLMRKIEEGGDEIHDDVYTVYCNLISLNSDDSTHYRHFLIENGVLNRVTLQESTNIISQGTTGLCSWQGAAGLSKWCTQNKSELTGKSVLELGCGVGLTGLHVISTCSPKEYAFSDCHEAVLAMVCKNIKLNLLHDEQETELESQLRSDRLKLQIKYNDSLIKVIELKWEDIENYIAEEWTVPDIIIAADVLYEKDSFCALATGLKAFLSYDGRYAVIAATIRNEDTFSLFLNELGVHDLSFNEYTQPEQVIHVELASAPIRILKIFQKT